LPSRIELESLIDITRSPRIDDSAFPNTVSNYYFSATKVSSFNEAAWIVHFGDGTSYTGHQLNYFLVRCVRGGVVPDGERYTVDGDTVIDNRTRLVWRKNAPSQVYDATAARAYCSTLGEPWRVPTFKELLTLFDPSRKAPMIDPLFGMDGPSFGSYSQDVSERYALNFFMGYSTSLSAPIENLVRCVHPL
jgi:hypothetical protein